MNTLIEAAKTLGQQLATASQDLDDAARQCKRFTTADNVRHANEAAARHATLLDLLNRMPFEVQSVARRHSAELLNPPHPEIVAAREAADRDLRNFISDARARWEPHLGAEYMDDLDELVRQALIAHRAALAALAGEGDEA